MKKNLLPLIVLFLSAPALGAVPCSHEAGLVQPDLSGLEFGGLAAQGTNFDIKLDIGPDLILTLVAADETQVENPGNTIDLQTGILNLDCVSFLSETFWLELELVSEEPTVDLKVNDFGTTFNPAFHSIWDISYSNDFADDLLIIEENGAVNLGGNPGVLDEDEDGFFFDLTFSTFAGTLIRPGGFSGTFNHLGETGEFEATPRDADSTLSLRDERFRVELEWRDFSDNTGSGQAVQLTEDSGAFYFFDPNNIEMTVRVLDRCNIAGLNHYWVFAAGTTDVEYTMTVTDTQTSESRVYGNPLGTQAPAIVDTQAFATCP